MGKKAKAGFEKDATEVVLKESENLRRAEDIGEPQGAIDAILSEVKVPMSVTELVEVHERVKVIDRVLARHPEVRDEVLRELRAWNERKR